MSDDEKKPYETRDVWLTRGEGDGWIGISPLVHPKCTKCGTTLRPTLTFSTDNGVVDQRNWCVDCTRVALIDMAALVYERDAAREEATRLTRERDKFQALAELGEGYRRERDKARDEVEQLRELLDENAYERGLLARRMTEAQIRRDELGAEVERLTAEVEMLRGVGCCESDKLDEPPSGPCGVCRKCAYRRGAEAMREACARVADAHCVPGTRDVIRGLSIPEDS
jgi:hypothetical protein